MTMPTTSTPHDAVFKTFLHHPETARDFLDIHLPAELRMLCDLNSLKLESESFIEADLRSRYSCSGLCTHATVTVMSMW